ncbi:insulin-like peptide receptor [Saccoglossus kowalevskii]
MQLQQTAMIQYRRLFLLLFTIVTLISRSESRIEEHVCSSIDIRNGVEQFQQLDNCTVIEGYLQILLIDSANPSDYTHLKFPKLREITDFLLLFRVKGLTTLAHIFPNLAVIRGHTLFFDYALVIFEMQDLREIGLYSLTTLQRGGVRIEKNPSLCYLDTVNFDVLVQRSVKNYIKENKQQAECVNMCQSSRSRPCYQRTWLSAESHDLCWTATHCQKACPYNCHDNCRTGIEPLKCDCDSQCIGGCVGNGVHNCVACRNFYHDGRCMQNCPSDTLEYLNRRCISRSACPRGWKIYKNTCIKECPPDYTVNETDSAECLPCVGPCPKVCEGRTVDSVASAQLLHGCTIINGSLKITISGAGNPVAELEANLGLIELVEDYVEISHAFPVVSLSFLKRLKRIRGQNLHSSKYAIYVLDNQNLQHLFDWEQKPSLTMDRGKLFFHFNPNLCPSHITELENHVGLGGQERLDVDISTTTNGNQVACEMIELRLVLWAFERHMLLGWTQYVTDDERDLLSFQVSWREAPENVTEFDGQDACGSSTWERVDLGPKEYNHIITRLKPYTRYAVFVKTYTIAGTSTGAKSVIEYATTKQDNPSAPMDLKVHPKSSSELLLKWNPPEEPNGNVTHYYVYISKLQDDVEAFSQQNYCEPGLKLPEHTAEPIDTEKESATNFTDGCCACPDPEKELKIAEEEAMRKAFENFLHNNVYVSRPIPNEQYERIKRDELSQTLPGVNTTQRILRDVAYSPGNNISVTIETQPEAPSEDPVNGNSTTDGNEEEEEETVYDISKVDRTDHLMVELDHFTMFYLKVQACNDAGCSPLAVSYARTLPDPLADNIPSNVTSTVITNKTHYREVLLEWEEPQKPNGLIIFYDIAYIKQKDDVVIETGMSGEVNENEEIQEKSEESICISYSQYKSLSGYLLSGLEAGNYSARVRASSLSGNGSWTASTYFVVPDEPPTELPVIQKSPYSDGMVVLIGGIVGGVVTILIILGLFGFWYVRKRYMNNGVPNGVLYASYNPEYLSAADVYVPDEWEVPREKIHLIRELGQGSFGMVYEGEAKHIQDDEDKRKVAVKTVNENASIRDRIEFLNEASIMKAFNCHHVVRLLGVVSKGQPTLVVMELMARGDLKNWLRSHRADEPSNEDKLAPTVGQILHMAAEIADGMAYLAAQKFVHRDLAARNCMVDDSGTVKIGDFGMTRDIYETDYYRKGGKGLLPVRWMGPESLKDGIFTSHSDVWSYGVVLWEMATLAEQPYQGLSNEQVLKYVIDGNSLDKPTGCPDRMFELMALCWQYNPKMRPTFIELIENLESHGNIEPSFTEVSFYHSVERHHTEDTKMEEAIPLMDDFDHRNESEQPNMNPSSPVRDGPQTSPLSSVLVSHMPKNGVLNGSAIKVPKCTTC